MHDTIRPVNRSLSLLTTAELIDLAYMTIDHPRDSVECDPSEWAPWVDDDRWVPSDEDMRWWTLNAPDYDDLPGDPDPPAHDPPPSARYTAADGPMGSGFGHHA